MNIAWSRDVDGFSAPTGSLAGKVPFDALGYDEWPG